MEQRVHTNHVGLNAIHQLEGKLVQQATAKVAFKQLAGQREGRDAGLSLADGTTKQLTQTGLTLLVPVNRAQVVNDRFIAPDNPHRQTPLLARASFAATGKAPRNSTVYGSAG